MVASPSFLQDAAARPLVAGRISPWLNGEKVQLRRVIWVVPSKGKDPRTAFLSTCLIPDEPNADREH